MNYKYAIALTCLAFSLRAEEATLPKEPTANTAMPADPTAPHDPGIYLMTTQPDGSQKLVLLERTAPSRNKTANVIASALSSGLSKARWKAELSGAQAALRSTETKPEFYLYFPPTGNLAAPDALSSPSQFSLVLLENNKDHRETTVAKSGLGGFSIGADEKRTVRFTAQMIRPYAYKVTPDTPLRPGEYAFLAATGLAGAASASALFLDFGIDAK